MRAHHEKMNNLAANNKSLKKASTSGGNLNMANLATMSMKSGNTRRTFDQGTKSRKSRYEENFEEMDLDEIDILID